MTRKPRRHALTVPVRSGSEVGFPQSLGEVHDMLYDKSLERDNCGFGLIAHIEGEPSHKVVRTAIHALARMQHRGAILADGKTGDGCGLLLQKPDRFFRIVAEERGWRLAKNYAVGMLFLNKDPELAKAALKVIRVAKGTTPIDGEAAVGMLIEEIADVQNCIAVLSERLPGLRDKADKISVEKMKRWEERLRAQK